MAGLKGRTGVLLERRKKSDKDTENLNGSYNDEPDVGSPSCFGSSSFRKSKHSNKENYNVDKKALEDIANISFEVDKISEEVAKLEVVIYRGERVSEDDVLKLSARLEAEEDKLDEIMANGDAKLKRREQINRVQKYVEDLVRVKNKNTSYAKYQVERKTFVDIANISVEVNKISAQVAILEVDFCEGITVSEKAVLDLHKMLEAEQLKLNGIVANGVAKLQKKKQVSKVNKYLEDLRRLKINIAKYQVDKTAFEAVVNINIEVNKLSKQVVGLELDIHGGKKVLEKDISSLIVRLEAEQTKLDMLHEANGDAKLKRKEQARRVQKYLDDLEKLKKNL